MSKAHRPKLGQHFLASEGFRRRIADALPLCASDLVIEIGPGRGAMTRLLAKRAGRVLAIELDAALAADLRATHAANPRIEILQSDILTADLRRLCRERGADSCFAFGNIPYYITSPILYHLMESAEVIHGMALLVQREVAERLVARPGSRDYGYLSVLVQVHAEPRIAFRVPPGAFSPPPKVQSALVEFRMQPKFPAWTPQARREYLQFVQLCFAHKRKSLVNTLGSAYERSRIKAALADMNLTEKSRAEELSVGQFADLRRRL
jgi:16S rRNA (adenine1518-N6/adenine1519-N6)-dimethyltransferase